MAWSETVDSLRKRIRCGYKVRVKTEIKALFVFLFFKVKPCASPGLELWSLAKVLNSTLLFTCVKTQTHQEKNRRQEEHGAARHLHPLRR